MMNTATHWALLLGLLTLASWIAGGLAAVVGHAEFGQHRQRSIEYLTLGLNGVAFVSAVAMGGILVI